MTRNRLLIWAFTLLPLAIDGRAADDRVRSEPAPAGEARAIRLEECVHTALLQNRALQIERLNPAIARSWLNASYSYYDPVLMVDARTEEATDTGGFDPSDFSRDAVYSADAETVRGGLTGFLPTGLSYAFTGGYAHSDGFRNGFNFESYSLAAGVTVRQPLLRNFWIDQGRMTIQVNKQNLKIAELGVNYLAMDVINRVQQAYYELAAAGGEARVRHELLGSRQKLLSAVRRKIELGTLTVMDEHLAHAEVARAEADLTLVDNAVQLAENELKSLLGDGWTNSMHVRLEPADPLLVLPGEFGLPTCWERGLALRPDLLQLREDVEKSRVDVRYRRNQLFPALDLVAGHNRKGSSTDQLLPPLQPSASLPAARDQLRDGDAPTDVVGVVFTMPLTLSAERGNFRAAKHTLAQSELRVKQLEEMVLREISDAVHTARSRYQHVGLTRRARELAEAALAAEEQKLAGGNSTLFFVLQLQGDLANARSLELRARADYNRALSQLHFAEASLLEQWRFSILVR